MHAIFLNPLFSWMRMKNCRKIVCIFSSHRACATKCVGVVAFMLSTLSASSSARQPKRISWSDSRRNWNLCNFVFPQHKCHSNDQTLTNLSTTWLQNVTHRKLNPERALSLCPLSWSATNCHILHGAHVHYWTKRLQVSVRASCNSDWESQWWVVLSHN